MTTRQVFVVTALFGASVVYADDFVDKADANGDGFVSLYELRAAHYADPEFNRRIEQSFLRYDRNGDGRISEDERKAVRAASAPAQTSAPPEKSPPPDTTKAEIAMGTPAIVAPIEPEPLVEPPTKATPEVSNRNVEPRQEGQVATLDSRNFSRSERMIMEIDTDNSGGVSYDELVASGDGQQWFTGTAFSSADRDGDKDLDSDELEALLQSLERRAR